MRAAVLTKEKTFTMESREIPSPGPGEVVVRVRNVGICGSDVHYWAHGKCGAFIVKGPLVLGHESSGEVIRVHPDDESNQKGVRVGDRVALEPGVPCRHCQSCRGGRYNLCKDVRFHATPPIDGTLCQYVVHPADFCFPLPQNVSLEEGALIEPLSVALHACDRAQVSLGSQVLITGAGPIGLVCVLAARAAGATRIIITDVVEDRLRVARELGATHTLSATRQDLVQAIKDACGNGEGADVTMDASGAEPAIRAGMQATRPGGKYVSIGRGAKDLVSIPLFEVMDKEIDILGVFRYRNTYGKAVSLLAEKRINVMPLITHRFSLENVLEAFETAAEGRDGAIKVMLSI